MKQFGCMSQGMELYSLGESMYFSCRKAQDQSGVHLRRTL